MDEHLKLVMTHAAGHCQARQYKNALCFLGLQALWSMLDVSDDVRCSPQVTGRRVVVRC
jgi:hypothetical protein